MPIYESFEIEKSLIFFADYQGVLVRLCNVNTGETLPSSRSMSRSEARDLAHWILENVPEAPARDREADMRDLAYGILNFLMKWPGHSIYSAIWGISTDPINQADPNQVAAESALRYLGVEPGYKYEIESYTADQLNYGQSLVDDLPAWIRDRALGIGGD